MSSSTSDSEEFYDAFNELPTATSATTTTATFSSRRPNVAGLSPNNLVRSTTDPQIAASYTSTVATAAAAAAAASQHVLNSPSRTPLRERANLIGQNKQQHASNMQANRLLSDESPLSRRKRLRNLRHKMIDEFETGAETADCSTTIVGSGGAPDNLNALESMSDISSLASWGKTLLKEDTFLRLKNQGGGWGGANTTMVVQPIDSLSTKATSLFSTANLGQMDHSAKNMLTSAQQQEQVQTSSSVMDQTLTSKKLISMKSSGKKGTVGEAVETFA